MSNNTDFLTTTATPTNATTHHFVSAEGGIFSGKSVLSSPLALFLVQATLIISLARVIHWGLHKLRQPRVIAEIIGGICLGPSILGHIPGFTETIFPKHSLPTLTLVSSFGLVLYMFLMGLELDTQILFHGVKRLLLISIAGIILPGFLGCVVSYGLYEYLLEPEKQAATPFLSFLLFTFVGMAITAFPVLARILTEKKLLSTTVGLMSIGAAAINDIFAWILLALVISIVNAGDPFTAIYVLIACSIYAAFLLVPVRILLKMLFEKFLGGKNNMLNQVTLAAIFVMIFLSAWTTEWIGVHAIFGAFLIGLIIPRVGGMTMELTHKLEDLVGIAFLPLYFASSGLKTQLGLLNDWTTALFLILVVIVACVGKILGCTLAAKYGGGFNWRESFSIGILMNTKGLVELIVLNIGLDAGVINDRIFVILVLMALITTFMTSPLIAFVYPSKYQLSKRRTTSTMRKVRPSALTWPTVDDKILVYLKDIDSVPLMANILQMFKASLAPGKTIHLNGLKAYTDLERSSTIMVSTQAENVIENDPTMKIFKFFGKILGAKTKSFVAQSRLSEIGTEVDKVAAAEQCDMVLVPWQQDAPSNEQQEASISIIDSLHIIVGIFVDRRSPGFNDFQLDDASGFVNILIPFIGGPSDRAALQLAFRFRNQSNIHLTVLHLIITGHPPNKLDNDLLNTTQDMSKAGDVDFKIARVTHDYIKPVLEELKNSQTDLIIMGHTKMLRRNSIIENGNNEQKNYNLIRRLSIRNQNQEISNEEKIFGSLGSQLYSIPKVPSLFIIHEPTQTSNGA